MNDDLDYLINNQPRAMDHLQDMARRRVLRRIRESVRKAEKKLGRDFTDEELFTHVFDATQRRGMSLRSTHEIISLIKTGRA